LYALLRPHREVSGSGAVVVYPSRINVVGGGLVGATVSAYLLYRLARSPLWNDRTWTTSDFLARGFWLIVTVIAISVTVFAFRQLGRQRPTFQLNQLGLEYRSGLVQWVDVSGITAKRRQTEVGWEEVLFVCLCPAGRVLQTIDGTAYTRLGPSIETAPGGVELEFWADRPTVKDELRRFYAGPIDL
jgi:hypothetical protein